MMEFERLVSQLQVTQGLFKSQTDEAIGCHCQRLMDFSGLQRIEMLRKALALLIFDLRSLSESNLP